jgi:hypothetical protein
MHWFYLTQYIVQSRAVMSTAMKFRVSLKADNFLTAWPTISFSRRAVLRGVKLMLNESLCLMLQLVSRDVSVTFVVNCWTAALEFL